MDHMPRSKGLTRRVRIYITYEECLLIYKALIRSYSFTYATDDEEMHAMVNEIVERPAGRLILSKFQKKPPYR